MFTGKGFAIAVVGPRTNPTHGLFVLHVVLMSTATLIWIIYIAALALQQKHLIVATDAVWPIKLKIILSGSSQKKKKVPEHCSNSRFLCLLSGLSFKSSFLTYKIHNHPSKHSPSITSTEKTCQNPSLPLCQLITPNILCTVFITVL